MAAGLGGCCTWCRGVGYLPGDMLVLAFICISKIASAGMASCGSATIKRIGQNGAQSHHCQANVLSIQQHPVYDCMLTCMHLTKNRQSMVPDAAVSLCNSQSEVEQFYIGLGYMLPRFHRGYWIGLQVSASCAGPDRPGCLLACCIKPRALSAASRALPAPSPPFRLIHISCAP